MTGQYIIKPAEKVQEPQNQSKRIVSRVSFVLDVIVSS